MRRYFIYLLIAALLNGCGGMQHPVPTVWRVVPAVQRLHDGSLIEWHDFQWFC